MVMIFYIRMIDKETLDSVGFDKLVKYLQIHKTLLWELKYTLIEKQYNELEEKYIIREEEVKNLWKNILNPKQESILKEIYTNGHKDKSTLTSWIRILNRKLGIPSSTIRWNLVRLRDDGLVKAGSIDEKGMNLELTYIGKLIAEDLYN